MWSIGAGGLNGARTEKARWGQSYVWSLFADRAAPIKSKWGCAIAIKEDIKKHSILL
jgi:hypothetical protein